MTVEPPAKTPARYAGLDGMRAIAVALVVIYHLFPGSAVQGGFIGVDVFFVISGFLITTLLLRETATTGRIALGAFWQRRARRLLPALAAVVTVCATAAWFVGGDVLVRLGEQVLGAATFSYNWISIAGGGGYFSAATPELFRNFWSLAVEEQFYVVWPLLLPLFLLLPRAWGRAAATLALALASAAWMGALVSAGGDVTCAYFGTDTHAFGILLGIALAFVLESVLGRAAVPSRRVSLLTVSVGAAALTGLALLALVPPSATLVTFPGAVLAASVCSAAAIVAGVWPGSAFGPALDAAPLRWVGDRSYGIYLWHWPLLVLLAAGIAGTGPDAGVPVPVGALALVLTLVAAELSYRLLETPVRRYGFRGSAVRVGRRLAGSPAVRVRALTAVVATVLLLGGTSGAIAAAPDVSSGQAAVLAGMDAVRQATGASAASGGSSASAAATPEPEPSATPDVPMPAPTPVAGTDVSAIGDSVMLASAPALLEKLPGIQVDAEVSRSTHAGPGILQNLASSGQLRPYVVIALGTNGALSADAMEQMAQIAGPDRSLVLVDAFAPRDWIPGVNADLAAFADAHPGVVVAHWSDAIAGHIDLLAGDQIHPGAAAAASTRTWSPPVSPPPSGSARTRSTTGSCAPSGACTTPSCGSPSSRPDQREITPCSPDHPPPACTAGGLANSG
ncbi:acyltransferase family protein [uncultured Microbacterium sp.]|uniref:acyltransferase family protein n=1 Tax=uncultured Microbacterium sp. TaxID=191216 RepID=UPI0028D85AC0|nr:acyltransferase family protein [uncultured Microbacterium sp.]